MDFPALPPARAHPFSAAPAAPPFRAFELDPWVGWSRETWLHEPCQHRQAELKFSLVAGVAKGQKVFDAECQIVSRQNERPLDRVL